MSLEKEEATDAVKSACITISVSGEEARNMGGGVKINMSNSNHCVAGECQRMGKSKTKKPKLCDLLTGENEGAMYLTHRGLSLSWLWLRIIRTSSLPQLLLLH